MSSPRTVGATGELTRAGEARAEQLYERVFVEYGDDSVAQLGGVHLACEQASQLLCKALEWGRLAAYLEQSTRYMRYDDRPGDAWRATVPPEIAGTALEPTVRRVPRHLFEAYGRMYEPMERSTGAVPQGRGGLRLRLPLDDHGEDVRHAADAAARRDALEPGDLRDRPVVRTAPDAPGRAPARRDARVRRADAGGAAQGDPRVPESASTSTSAACAWSAYWRETRAGMQESTAEGARRRSNRSLGRGHAYG
jgi:hypothetical protein